MWDAAKDTVNKYNSLDARVKTNSEFIVTNDDRITQLEAGTTLDWVSVATVGDVGQIWYSRFGDLTYWRGVIPWTTGSNPGYVWSTESIPINGQAIMPCGVRGDNPVGTIGFASVFIQATGITLGVEFTVQGSTSSIEFFGMTVN